MINAESVKAKLKNQAPKRGHMLQEALTAYGLERTIYRISISEYVEKFTLKGGIFLYALFEGNFTRATTDIDLLAQKTSNEVENIKKIFNEIFLIEVDDALSYDLDSLDVHSITKVKAYHGVNVSIVAYLDKTKIPISIDIGFGDIVYPERVRMDFPVLLKMEVPKIYAYSLNSVIAEKFEAIVALGYVNSRYKDFYDIYILASKYVFDGNELKNAIEETFHHRQTGFNDIVAFEKGFAEDAIRKSRWNSFIKKKKAMESVDFRTAVDTIRNFLQPIVEAINENKVERSKWMPKKKQWNRKDKILE
ncbi:MAG: nucleotidyl transferase AbiEii/AbiGii toxin family protein [Suipraeoptans sp.]